MKTSQNHSAQSSFTRRTSRKRPMRSAQRKLRCEYLERRELLDAAGLLPSLADPQASSSTAFFGPDGTDPRLASATIEGVVWADFDGDGVRGSNEPGIAGVKVYSDLNSNGWLDDDEPWTESGGDDLATDFDETGHYALANLAPGFHLMRQVVPQGAEQTFPTLPAGHIPPPWGDGNAQLIFAGSGATVDGIHFGNRRLEPGGVAGVKWVDQNGNGQRDPNEPGAAGVTIYSDRNFNGQLDPDEPHVKTSADNPDTDFDESGIYRITGLHPGFHSIREVIPEGYRQTFPLEPWPFPEPWFDANVDLAAIDPSILPPWPWGDGAHNVFLGSGQSLDGLDFGNQKVEPGSIAGVKWLDANGDGKHDPNESGLAGVTLYLDANQNGRLDADERRTVTSKDDPATDFDEAGRYQFDHVPAGVYLVREVVPDGYRQTYPRSLEIVPLPMPIPNPGDLGEIGIPTDDENATVDPRQIVVTSPPGEVFMTEVAITVHPLFIRALEIDLVASIPDVEFANLSGVQVNGGGGDTSKFEIMIINLDNVEAFDIQFVDVLGGDVIASIPVRFTDGAPSGAHRVALAPGQSVDGLDFGNQPTTGNAGVSGRKWLDRNGNGVQEADEPGLGGVTIYDDANRNGSHDVNERWTVTREDNPATDFDEAGLYVLGNLNAGSHWIAEVVPPGFEQTFPNNPIIAIFPPPPGGGVHEVELLPGASREGLNFGNRRVGFGAVTGVVWEDANANAEFDPNEGGMAGITVYADRNFNGRLDPGEQSTLTQRDDPNTRVNEAGRYRMEVGAGAAMIRQVAPTPYEQTYPQSDAAIPHDDPVGHFVSLAQGDVVERLDFGNFIQREEAPPMSDDRNGDGVVDDRDLEIWGKEFGLTPTASHDADSQDAGLAFLQWQLHAGQKSPEAEAVVADDLGRNFLALQRGESTALSASAAITAPAASSRASAVDAALASLPQRSTTSRRTSGWRSEPSALDAALSDNN